VVGGEGRDLIDGWTGSDSLAGGEGGDLINGWTGTDRMLGGGGGDQIIDGEIDEASKDDVLSGAGGNDLLVADNVPVVRDIVSCGGGFDWVLADRKDVVADDCERVRVVHGSRAQVLDQEEAFFESLPPSLGEEFFDTFFEEQLAPFPNG
jgi:Ca2+-binding RTX toxin-like protein